MILLIGIDIDVEADRADPVWQVLEEKLGRIGTDGCRETKLAQILLQNGDQLLDCFNCLIVAKAKRDEAWVPANQGHDLFLECD